ncbi:MFS transporter [Streptomyces sp. NPDC046275]|uniref:MFS transporter n=1 Tax=Streptomyces sp. NPDC046275 TaxID=3157201 RepID=UPI0033C45FFF
MPTNDTRARTGAPAPTPAPAPPPGPRPEPAPGPEPVLAAASAPGSEPVSAAAPELVLAAASAPGSEPVPAPAGAPGPAPAAAPGPGYGAVLAVREFRFVFAAHLCSLLGVVVSELALTVLVYELTRSPLLSSLTFALGFLPYLLGGTLLAGLADRVPPRRLLVGADLLCAGCVGLMTVPLTPVAGLLALRCALAVVAPVFQGARTATLADILGEGELFVLGRSLLRIVSQSALLAGFAAGGLLLTAVPPRGALLVTAGTFLGSALLLRLGTARRPARGAGHREGLGATWGVLRDRRTRALLLMFWVPPLFAVVPEALAAPFADGAGASTAALGLLMCALPVGTVLGELLAGSLLSAAARARIVLPLAVAGLLPFLVYATGPGVALAAAALFLAGATGAYTLGLDAWFVAAVPEERRGRAMTLMSAGLMTSQGLGMAAAGLAAEFAPVHTVVAGAGVLGTVCVALLAREVRATAPGRAQAGDRSRADRGPGGPQAERAESRADRRPSGPKGEPTERRDAADRHMTSG